MFIALFAITIMSDCEGLTFSHTRKLGGERTTRLDLTGPSMSSRPRNSRTAGPIKGQKFSDVVDQ